MEAACSSEMSVAIRRITWRYIPEERIVPLKRVTHVGHLLRNFVWRIALLFTHVYELKIKSDLLVFITTRWATPSASETFTKSSKSLYRIAFFTRGPQKETLAETKIYSIVMGPSVSQIAGASPFCRALKVCLVEEWNKLGLLRILLLPPLSGSFLGRNEPVPKVTWQPSRHSA
jgi:hypothetical protein